VEKIAVPSSALPNPLREGLVEERIPEPATMEKKKIRIKICIIGRLD